MTNEQAKQKAIQEEYAGSLKKKLLVSFSGGRTSAYMLWIIWMTWRGEYDIIVVFANTGKEAEETLQFVHRIEIEWDIPIIWVEAVPASEKGWSVTFKVVSFETASRKGEPFEAMISKLGIPTTGVPFCSDQLKGKAIKAVAKALKWPISGHNKYYTAIGIRSDEVDRMNEHFRSKRILYPLIGPFPTTKQMIIDWWAAQPFDLTVEPGEGNCDGCWKKDLLTLCRTARRKPQVFDWWQEMTDKYGHHNPRNSKLKPPFNFYRGNLSPGDIIELSKLSDAEIRKMAKGQKLNGCSESCEVSF